MPSSYERQCVIVTTINQDLSWVNKFDGFNYDLIIIGDIKTPNSYKNLGNCIYLDIEDQHKLFPQFSSLLPLNHYSRKNIGYLFAIKEGYDVIWETDDDNYPIDGWGLLPTGELPLITAPSYPNIYSLFSDKHIWARGYPLDQIREDNSPCINQKINTDQVGVWQGLVEGDPDFDAIYRLTSDGYEENAKYFSKNDYSKIGLGKNVFSPGNTQNTLWVAPELFYYLYLPSTVTMRFCDILKSYVFQPGLWKKNKYFAFTEPTMFQNRNKHNLMSDFISELPMYTKFYEMIDVLQNVPLAGEPNDLLSIYKELLKKDIVGIKEIETLKEWLKNIEKLNS